MKPSYETVSNFKVDNLKLSYEDLNNLLDRIASITESIWYMNFIKTSRGKGQGWTEIYDSASGTIYKKDSHEYDMRFSIKAAYAIDPEHSKGGYFNTLEFNPIIVTIENKYEMLEYGRNLRVALSICLDRNI